MNEERTFVMIRPAYVHAVREIFADLDQQGKRIAEGRVDSVPRELIERHYEEHRNKPFYRETVDAHAGRPVAIAVYQGEDIVAKIVNACGPTDPAPNTIRGKYAKDSKAQALAEGRLFFDNVIHRADSVTSAEREIALWGQFLHPTR
ncbi:MAG: nucleoside-diphosphate kinase [Nanoarchaeota archaeon]|nr:nucleoside-diphosphate kinase [Nanoarchaeota archaeon]MBU0978134.1 nucleoside-diphosphate kinase [Nanoarchaeota archaeon]